MIAAARALLATLRLSRLRAWLLVAACGVFGFGCVGSVAQAAGVDTTPPQLLTLSLSTAVVDVTQGPATLTVTLEVTDTGGSHFYPKASTVWLITPGARPYEQLVYVQGSNHLYTATFQFGQYSQMGVWQIYQVHLYDRAGNHLDLTTDDLAQAGFPTSFTVVGPPPNPDHTPPLLESFSGFSPTDIDLSNGPVTATATLRATDDASGVRAISGLLTISAWGSFLVPTVTQLSADTYQLTLTFPADSKLGLWKLGDPALQIFDNAGNYAHYTAADLVAAGASGTAFVVSKTVPPQNQSVPIDGSGPPAAATRVPIGSTVTWLFPNQDGHGIVDLSGMGLYGVSSVPAAGSYAFEFDAAGTYRYRDPAAPSATGKVEVPIQVSPDNGPLVGDLYPVANVITVTWAAGAPPPGYVYDVQIKRPGSSAYTDWLPATVQAKATFQPDSGLGTYAFQARLRNLSNNTSSGWSPQHSFTATFP